MMTVAWRGKPVWIINRTDKQLADVQKADKEVADPESKNPFSMPEPDYTKNEFRSRADHKNLFVAVAVCTHLGCAPKYKPEPGSVSSDWLGGFFCPCHGSKFDLAGRVLKNVPAPTNLEVPPYRYLSDTVIEIGTGPA